MDGKQTNPATSGNARRIWHSKTFKQIAGGLLVVGVFVLGLNIGNGSIQFSASVSTANSDLPARLDYSSVDSLYDSIKENYNGKLTEAQLLDGIKHGLAQATGDPYTVYFTPSEANEFKSDLQNTFSGIGAELGKSDQGYIQVIAPISGTPAEKAGVRSKDIIASINGKTTLGMSIDSAVKQIRGKAGTKVKLELVRGDDPITLEITRQTIQVPSVTSRTLDDGTAYIRISSFSSDTGTAFSKAAAEVKQSGAKLVLDMRNNPGGEVDAAIQVASEWLPEGSVIMQEKRGDQIEQTYRSSGMATLKGIKTVVLINGGSASAAEIVAAALRDNNQAYLMGEKSYGKGSVQRLVDFKNGSELKVTVAAWHRPNGKNINHQGIKPDKPVALSDEDAAASNDTQLKAAQSYLQQ